MNNCWQYLLTLSAYQAPKMKYKRERASLPGQYKITYIKFLTRPLLVTALIQIQRLSLQLDIKEIGQLKQTKIMGKKGKENISRCYQYMFNQSIKPQVTL